LVSWLVRGELREILNDERVDDFASIIVSLMGIRTTSPLLRAVGDAERRALEQSVLHAFLERDAEVRPIVLVLEDLHALPNTARLVAAIAERPCARVLVVVTTREDVFGDRPGVLRTLTLGALTNAECAALIHERLDAPVGVLPDEFVTLCTALAEGYPGLLDEAFAAFEASGVLRRSSGVGQPPTFALDVGQLPPVTTSAISRSAKPRVLSLGPRDFRVLQHAAIVGSVFWAGAVVAQELAIASPGERLSREEIECRLLELAALGYLVVAREPSFSGELELAFKYSIEREYLLRTVPDAERARRHVAVADWLDERPEAWSDTECLTTLGTHLESCAHPEHAAEAYLAAATTLESSRSLREVVPLYRRGLELLGPTPSARRLDALHDYGVALVGLGELGEALRVFGEMLDVASTLSNVRKAAIAHGRIGRIHRERGDFARARDSFRLALELFEEAEDVRGIASAHDDLGRLHWMLGEYRPARAHLKQALELRSASKDVRGLASSLDGFALLGMDSGHTEQAIEALTLAGGLFRALGDELGIVQCLHDLGRLALRQNDAEKALETLLDALDGASELNGYPFMARLLIDIAECHRRLGELDAALVALEHAERVAVRSGERYDLGELRRLQAKVQLDAGDAVAARASIEAAMSLCDELGSRRLRAATLRTLGEITAALATDDAGDRSAASCFVSSVEVGKELGCDLEVAETYYAFARSAQTCPRLKDDPNVRREAEHLEEIAREMFEDLLVPLDDGRWSELRASVSGALLGAPANAPVALQI
ncbi:MAG: tetratricopeptide repeat protein, partial [Pseudomonadota bacterium]